MNASGVGLGSEEPFRDAKCFLCQIAFFVKNNKDLTEKPSGVFLTCVRCSNTYHPGCVQVSRSETVKVKDNYTCPMCIPNEPPPRTAKKTCHGRVVLHSSGVAKKLRPPAPMKRHIDSGATTDTSSTYIAVKMARMFGDAETPANNGQPEQGSAKHQLPEKIHQGPANVLSGSSSGASSAHIPAKMARLFDDEEADANNMWPQKGPNQQQLPDKLHQGPANVAGGSSHSGVNGGKRVVMDPSEKLVAENKVLRLAVQFLHWKLHRHDASLDQNDASIAAVAGPSKHASDHSGKPTAEPDIAQYFDMAFGGPAAVDELLLFQNEQAPLNTMLTAIIRKVSSGQATPESRHAQCG